MTAEVTLYIPCYNSARYLDRVLPAILGQTHRAAVVLVIDDGSTDATRAIAEGHGVSVIAHGRNRGLGAARNTAVRAAQTEYVAALDSDVVPRPDWLERLVGHVAGRGFDGACGNLIETVRRTVADRWRQAHMQQGWGDVLLEDPPFLYGNNGLYRRQALIDAALYDESCRTNGEDVTLSANLKRGGARLLYDPQAVCEHLRADTIRSICRTYWNYHFYDQLTADRAFLDLARERSWSYLIGRFGRGDLAARRFDLVLLDVWMYLVWQVYGWRRYLGGRAARRRGSRSRS